MAFESAMHLFLLLLLLPGSFSASLTPVEEDDDGSGAGFDRSYMLPVEYTIEDAEEQIHFRKEGKPYLNKIECIS